MSLFDHATKLAAGLAGLLLLAPLDFIPTHASAAVGVVVGPAYGPPALIRERRPPRPHPGWIWRTGRWRWAGGHYVWLPGVWMAPPYVRAVWLPGHWVHRGRRWIWLEGHWA